MDIALELAQAKTAIQQKDHLKARSILRRVIQKEPRNVEAWLLLAEAAEKPEQAIQCLEYVLKLDPGNTTASLQLDHIRMAAFFGTSTSQESAPAAPQVTPSPAARPRPEAFPRQKPASGSVTYPSSKPKSKTSSLEKLMIGVIGLLTLCILCLVSYPMLSGTLKGLAASQPSPTPPDYAAELYENIRASNAENIQAYMATIHPASPSYATTEDLLKKLFETYDLSYKVSGVSVVEKSSSEVHLSFVLVTRKIRGPSFRDNQITGVMIMRKDGSVWKIYDQKVDNIQYLN